MMDFTPWVLFTDLGYIAILLIIGTISRAKVKFIQRLFIPASIIAGILGLIFGPNGINIIPFSQQIGTYPAILIAIIFGAIPLTSSAFNWSLIKDRVGSMWAYSQLSMIVMWGAGLLFSLLLINPFWQNINIGFGLILAAGFVGGHGSAAAVGETFSQHGWEDAMDLAMTSATVGVLASIILGILFIKIGSTKGQTSFLSSFDQLPNELRTGLIPSHRRKDVQIDTVSSISIDPFIFHIAIIFLIGLGGYYLSKLGEFLIPSVSIPVFSLAFIFGLLVKRLLQMIKLDQYISGDVVNSVSGSATDLLVAFGIASISISVVMKYAVPLIILFLFGLALAYFFFAFLTKRFFPQYWFERGVFTWGWNTGTVAMGIALLRIVDPELESRTLDDYGLAYIPIAPVEVLLITFAPLLVITTNPFIFITLTALFSGLIFVIAYKNKWFQPLYKGQVYKRL